MAIALLAPVAWLLGTFPSATLVARAKGHDIVREGSGNPGASNVARLLGWKYGAAVLVMDFAKGAIAAGAGLAIGGRPGAYVLGVAAVVGHTFPLYRKGGKGVASAGGMLVVLFPLIVLGLAVVWLVVARVLKKASLASLLITVLFPVAAAAMGYAAWEVAVLAALAVLVIARHAANIRRLLRREELDVRPELGARLHQVRKAVIPAAGLGTRFLPATKAVPKEMLPVIDRPAIQYVVEEAVRAGLTDILIVTGRNKRPIEEHFDRNFELETLLERDGKTDLLDEVRCATDLARVHYVRQKDALGLGHAVSVARDHVGDEPFVVLLPDDLMIDDSTLLRRMVDAWQRLGHAVIALEEVAPEAVSAYGCADPAGEPVDGLVELRGIVEKPKREDAPSNLAVSGRYLFPPDIFDALDRIEPGAGGELQLTDAIALLMKSQPVYGAICTFGRHDVGKKIDFLRATVELALDRDDLGPEFAAFLRDLVQRRGLQ